MAEEPRIAVFVDYENLAIGVRNMRKGNFKIDLVLRRLLEKGRIVYKRAYCDWGKYRNARPRVPRAGRRDDRHPAVEGERQEQRGHPHGGRRARPLSPEAAHRHVRAALRRQRLLAAGREAQGERQARDRLRREELDLRSADRELRRVHLLRRPGARRREAEAHAAEGRDHRRVEAPGGRRRSCSRSCARSSATTTPSGARW